MAFVQDVLFQGRQIVFFRNANPQGHTGTGLGGHVTQGKPGPAFRNGQTRGNQPIIAGLSATHIGSGIIHRRNILGDPGEAVLVGIDNGPAIKRVLIVPGIEGLLIRNRERPASGFLRIAYRKACQQDKHHDGILFLHVFCFLSCFLQFIDTFCVTVQS